MAHPPALLAELVLIVACAIPAVALAQRARIPSVVGFLLTGLLIGPHALSLVREVEAVAVLAEIGVVLLLFAIGLELSLSRVAKMARWVLRGGTAQVALTMLAVAGLGLVAGLGGARSVFYGSLAALSSTAIILKLLNDRNELDSPAGRVVVAILIFQDLCVVPLMLLVPFLGGAGETPLVAARMLGTSLATVAGLVVLGGLGVRWLFPRIVELRNRELFTLVVVTIGLGAAWVTAQAGLSLALGAFLAGLVISESEYGLQALSDILPFRDAFSGIFFISVGMLLDLRALLPQLPLVLGLALGVMVLKTLLVTGVVHQLGRSWYVGLVSGSALAGIGEFSFVLAQVGEPLGLFPEGAYQIFLGTSVLTMLIAPFLLAAGPAVAARVAGAVGADAIGADATGLHQVPSGEHVIIVGFGFTGRTVARALRAAGIPYVVLEENGPIVRQARLEREPVIFGDGTRQDVLEHVGVAHARAVVFCIASANEERRGVVSARRCSATVHIVVRTRRVRWARDLQVLGANEVIPEELEGSIEIFGRVLRLYGLAGEQVRQLMTESRRDDYGVLLGDARPMTRVDLPIPEQLRPRPSTAVRAVPPDQTPR
jgi:monovalent cation:H+ antiporter-2, CPA2 family